MGYLLAMLYQQHACLHLILTTVYPKKYAQGFVVLCFVVVMQSFIMKSHEVFIHIHQGCFAGTGAIVRLPQCQWSKPDGYGKISQCITTTKHSKAKTVCIFLGIYCTYCIVSAWHGVYILYLCRLYTQVLHANRITFWIFFIEVSFMFSINHFDHTDAFQTFCLIRRDTYLRFNVKHLLQTKEFKWYKIY